MSHSYIDYSLTAHLFLAVITFQCFLSFISFHPCHALSLLYVDVGTLSPRVILYSVRVFILIATNKMLVSKTKKKKKVHYGMMKLYERLQVEHQYLVLPFDIDNYEKEKFKYNDWQ